MNQEDIMKSSEGDSFGLLNFMHQTLTPILNSSLKILILMEGTDRNM